MPPLKIDISSVADVETEDAVSNITNVLPSKCSDAEPEVDYDHDITTLYEAITNEDWDAAIDAVRCNPSEARTWVVRRHADGTNMWRFLPLHSACARQPPVTLIKELLRAYGAAASARDDQGLYALHYASGNCASVDVLRQLLFANAGATTERDLNGMVPLHYLAQWGPSSIIALETLLLANKDVISFESIDGETALDLAIEAEYSERDAVVATLMKYAAKKSRSQREQPPPPENETTMVVMEVSAEGKKRNQGGVAKSVATSKVETALKAEIIVLKERAIAHEEELLHVRADHQAKIGALEARIRKITEENQTLVTECGKTAELKESSDVMRGQLIALQLSVQKLINHQNMIVTTVVKQDAEMKAARENRQQKLQELVAMDNLSCAKKASIESGASATSLIVSNLERQMKEMENMQSIIGSQTIYSDNSGDKVEEYGVDVVKTTASF